ncbi:MAG TPA: hypothetical protein P5514_02505 [Bacteroidales bacterium]|nr:hypothetical protein [Bacteroidales bacterium]
MQKLILLPAIIIISAITAFSQKYADFVHIQWGAALKEKKTNTLDDIVGYDDSGFFITKSVKRKIFIEHFNQELKKTNSRELVIEEGGKKRLYQGIKQINGELYLFSSFLNQKHKKHYLFVQTLNKQTLLPENDVKKIAEIELQDRIFWNAGMYGIDLSRDISHVLIYYDTPAHTAENKTFGVHVFDKEMNEEWEKFVTLPYEEDLFEVERFEVDNEGNVYIMGIAFKQKRKEKRNGQPNFIYEVLAYSDQGESMVKYPISLPGKFITDAQLTINNKKQIVCGGFYSEEGTWSIIGSFFLTVNIDTKEVATSSTKEFGIDFIAQNLTKHKEAKTRRKAEKGKDVELYKYDLHKIVPRSDGGAVLIGEQYFMQVSTTTTTDASGRMTYSTDYIFNYNDIIVININPDGTIAWNTKIGKEQTTKNDLGFYSSFALAVVDDNLYFIFNDNPKNLMYNGSGKLYNFRKDPDALTVVVKVDKTGEQTRKALFAAGLKDVLTRPKVCEQVSSHEVILYGERKKDQRLARLVFDE